MDITKKPYEISLWEDVLTFVYEDGYESENKIIGGHGQVKVQYYKERKLCIIGSDTMDTPIRAVQGRLNSKVNGENILTFNIYSHYYDEETNEYLPNPFIGYLVNERKVKLRHGKPGAADTKWYDFVIKNIQENSETKTYTYTAKDLFINELSKSGFNLVFNAELENNMGNIETLAARVLEESDWQLEGEAGLEQSVNEPLYIIKTSKTIVANNLKNNEELLELESGSIIYAFYNNIINAEPELQFLYVGPTEESYEIDDNSVITNSSNWIIETTYTQIDGINKPDFASTIAISDKFRGKRLVIQQRVDYDSTIDKYVKVYNDGQIYGFTKTEYTSPATVRSLVSNASGYENTNNWKSDGLNLEVVSVPDFRDIQDLNQFDESDLHSCLKFNASSNQSLYNSGIIDNRQYIDNFAEGEVYIFKIKCGLEDERGTYGAKTLKYGGIPLRLSVREYELKDGKFDFKDLPIYFDTSNFITQTDNNGYSQIRVTCQQGLSYSQMLEKGNNLGLFITSVSNQVIYIEDLQFFKYIDKGSDTPLLPDEIAESKILTTYYYYKPNSLYTSIEDLIPEAKSTEPILSYKPAYHDNKFEKIRSITASESNRFNLVQKLCEIFECWPKFRIEHKENGEILMENYRQRKFVSFHEYISNSDYNWAGFKYGINLKSIQRTLQSDSIATKLIVKDNSNEFAQDGACSIARATENPCGENFILDFGYYIQQGLLGLSELTNDLYLNTSGYIGYYTNLKHYNSLRDQYIQEQSGLLNDIAEYTSIKQTYENSVNQKEDQLRIALIEIKQVTGLSFEEFIEDKNNSWWNNNRAIALINQIGRLKASIPNHQILADNAAKNLEKVQNRYDELNRILTSKIRENDEPRLLLDKQELHLKFYKKYSRFLQEGSWISEDYIDNNLYFLDAQSTLYTSSRPRVEYNISVLELSQLKDYESFTFSLGDKTYIEDVEFFGWAPNGSPYREEIVVTELITVLDSPELNEIKVQNYKTQFEELFQRMAATTQAIEYSTGKYQRAADVVESDGTISITTLQNSIANNALIISNSKDQSVVWDETGITTTSPSAPNEIVRLVSGGLFLSNDGGITWNVGITGRGISASYITSGTIDTEQIRILNGAFPTFRWDSTGLNAYRFDTTEAGAPTNFYNNEFVRLDQYGLYGIRDQADFNPNEMTNGLKGIEKIKAYSNFALTWDGFQIKSTHDQGGYISITSENDFQVFNKQEQEVIKIGLLYENTTLTDDTGEEISGPLFGIRLKDGFGKTVMEHTNNGKIWIKDELQIGHEDKSSVSIGYLNEVKKNLYGEDTNIHEVFNANDKFIVYEDGTMKAIEGEFEGKIIATSGSIGGVDIEAYKEKIYEIFIESDDGTVFKNGKGIKTLTAHLYYGRTEILSGLTYQWYKNGKEIPYETEQQLTVSPDENNEVDSILDTDNAVYECRITHTT